MNIEKLKSGSYRIRQMYKGKKYSITVDHKPTQKEAVQLIAELLDNEITSYSNMTFQSACREYLKIKSNVLSPSTKRGYYSLIGCFTDRFKRIRLNDITQVDVQMEINSYACGHSPKTVSNMHGFLSAVIKEFRPQMNLYTKLPQKKVNTEGYIPSTEDIQRILDYAKGKPHELGIKLALCGLRRSEICALEPSDLDENNVLHINKAYVQGEDKKWYVKESNKTDSGTRDILLPQEFATLYRNAQPNKDNHVYGFAPNTLYDNLIKYEKDLNIPHFKLHSCRHYYCSLLHSQGVSDAVIQALGGWKSNYTMTRVYRHAMENDKRQAMEKISNIYEKI